MKATGITRLPCATDGKHYMIDSCELTRSGIPGKPGVPCLRATGHGDGFFSHWLKVYEFCPSGMIQIGGEFYQNMFR